MNPGGELWKRTPTPNATSLELGKHLNGITAQRYSGGGVVAAEAAAAETRRRMDGGGWVDGRAGSVWVGENEEGNSKS